MQIELIFHEHGYEFARDVLNKRREGKVVMISLSLTYLPVLSSLKALNFFNRGIPNEQ